MGDLAATAHPRVVIIGAGIVGCALADELALHGWTDVTVLDKGPLFATGGSTSHAPGLVSRTHVSRTMTAFASYTIDKYVELDLDGQWCFRRVGALEVAATPERWTDLKRKHGLATSWGVDSELVSPQKCRDLWSLLDTGKVLGGLYIPGDGLAKALRAAEAQARRATAAGARFLGHHTVTGIEKNSGRVTGVLTDRGPFPADVVVSAAGFWGPEIGRMAGITLPMIPLAHQYACTTAVKELTGTDARLEATLPILRHLDADVYYRQEGERIGIGSFGHRPLPVDMDRLPAAPAQPSKLAFTEDDFTPVWQDTVELLPPLADTEVADAFNGVFSFTPDDLPLMGESRRLRGFWVAEAVWVTHSAGVARALAEWLVDGQPALDVSECDLHRFEDAQLSPQYITEHGHRVYTETYRIRHPLDPTEPRPLRTSPFHRQQRDLGAYFLQAGGYQRPQWYEANAELTTGAEPPGRDAWSARHWSPIAAAEARITRERAALYDLTSVKRADVTGPGALALLQRLTTGDLAGGPGALTPTLMLNRAGGIRAQITIARLAEDHFRIDASGPLALDWLLRHLPEDGSVQVRDITSGTCSLGVFGPLAADLLPSLRGGPAAVQHGYVGHVPVVALRIADVGGPGWELHTSADLGARLWDTLWEAGHPDGLIAAGHSAFDSLRLEHGTRFWGSDLTSEHNPFDAGLGALVHLHKPDFIGRAALTDQAGQAPLHTLTRLDVHDEGPTPMGKEPVHLDDEPIGYVTSAGYGYTTGHPIAYARLSSQAARPGSLVHIEYFGQQVHATVSDDWSPSE